MGDIADRADLEIDTSLQEALYRIRSTKAQPIQQHEGECYCGDKLGVRFCGTECRDMYEREERAKRRAGR